ncbi:hypothetical protein J6590_081326 [Homalodisca vitripennis]|nr:hypothetical protein J6590_081326 [Homalodisca vitripennis]
MYEFTKNSQMGFVKKQSKEQVRKWQEQMAASREGSKRSLTGHSPIFVYSSVQRPCPLHHSALYSTNSHSANREMNCVHL